MKTILLTVNGKERSASVEPRTSLADYLREDLLLTGTHLGCEHGVCGSCTVNIDGAPVRSCITLAIACDGADVRTIEGFDDDQIMTDLRHAFTTQHALQCGYCTPGMLITARDIVQRHSAADENRIRVELSGNLCRCTGYVGIINAVHEVLEDKTRTAETPGTGDPQVQESQTLSVRPLPAAARSAEPHSDQVSEQAGMDGNMTRLAQSFTVPQSRDAVWAVFQDLPRIVACMPGASLDAPSEDSVIRGDIAVKLGPIHTKFSGAGEIDFDDAQFSGMIRGSGRDRGHGSQVRGEIHFELLEGTGSQATRVNVNIAFALSGALAQFSRGGIIEAMSDQLTEAFAANLRFEMDTANGSQPQSKDRPEDDEELDISSLIFRAIWARIRSIAAGLKRLGS